MSLPESYNFIAVFEYLKDGIHITFPDLPGCVSYGENEETALRCAREVLMLHLYGMEQDGDAIPLKSSLKEIQAKNTFGNNEICTMIDVYMPAFRERQAKRFVKKTLSIPSWLNAEAEHRGINFSQTLQAALKQQLQIQ